MIAIRTLPCLAVLLSGCAFQGRSDTRGDDLLRSAGSFEVLRSAARGEVVYADTVPARPEATFRALVDAYRAVGLMAERADDDDRVVAGHHPKAGQIAGRDPGQWFDCRSATTAGVGRYEIAIWFASRVLPLSAGSAIETILRADAFPVDASADIVPCTSSGELEEQLAERVRRAAQ